MRTVFIHSLAKISMFALICTPASSGDRDWKCGGIVSVVLLKEKIPVPIKPTRCYIMFQLLLLCGLKITYFLLLVQIR